MAYNNASHQALVNAAQEIFLHLLHWEGVTNEGASSNELCAAAVTAITVSKEPKAGQQRQMTSTAKTAVFLLKKIDERDKFGGFDYTLKTGVRQILWGAVAEGINFAEGKELSELARVLFELDSNHHIRPQDGLDEALSDVLRKQLFSRWAPSAKKIATLLRSNQEYKHCCAYRKMGQYIFARRDEKAIEILLGKRSK